MRVFILLSFCVLPLFATKLLDYNIYDRNDRVDITLSFDSAYKGHVTQKKENNFILLTLNELSFDKEKEQEFKSPILKKMLIKPEQNKVLIMFEAPNDTFLTLSDTNNKISLRIRALNKELAQSPNASAIPTNDVQEAKPSLNLETKEELKPKSSSLDGFDYVNYVLVLLVLFILLAVLWWIKNSLKKKTFNIKEFDLIYQRYLDKHNQFVILDYNDKRYVMIIGNSNVILDISDINKEHTNLQTQAKSEKSFNSIFEENKQKLQNLIQKNQGT
ncbi:hypothetical protein DMB92_03935 [Campylobacter sp. MIT 99-7217]|uniref:hypothetical protein n=1 Tax=Campylobacter sp. MIT 99-7217 TaxID=535091 RepID=UPI00115B2C50|nr:hypothetical protein [Campylobacter sp. MIT 99-7217]TQR33116.1 hypothetical protein DMB92_03935 [Campylobacter sp. MIT 99-7217]